MGGGRWEKKEKEKGNRLERDLLGRRRRDKTERRKERGFRSKMRAKRKKKNEH